MQLSKMEILKRFREDLETIYKQLERYDSPHYAIAFHIGDDASGQCGKSFGGIFPEDQRAHVSEEITLCGIGFLTEAPDHWGFTKGKTNGYNLRKEDLN